MKRLRTSHRGIAMVDFIAGSLIFSATLGVFVGFTKLKFDTLQQAEFLSTANSVVEAELDLLREADFVLPAQRDPDLDGFRELSVTPVESLYEGRKQILARALRVDGGSSYQLYEVEVQVTWRGGPSEDRDRVVGSIVLPLKAGGPR